jgi:hypothetical protein
MNPLKYPNYFEILRKNNNSSSNNFNKIKIKCLFNFNSFYLENFIQYYLLKISFITFFLLIFLTFLLNTIVNINNNKNKIKKSDGK